MSSSDAILVGEAWISEHYFTTDATSQSFQAKVTERRKTWDAEEKDGHPTPRTRFTAARQQLVSDLAQLGADLSGDEASGGGTGAAADLATAVHDRLVTVLGFDGHGLRQERVGPIVRVSAPGITERAPLVVLHASPVDAVEDLISRHGKTLAESVQLEDDGPEHASVARLLSALFVEDSSPELVLMLAGRWALLVERERWAEGRYLAIDVQAVAERNDLKRGGEVDKMLTCLSAESIAPNGDGDLWWTSVFEESIKHTVGVSQDLRDGVRLSIEIIANEVVDRRVAKNLKPLPGDQAQELARQSLRFLYRILFLLYAEASPQLGVLPAGVQQYDEGYSLDRLRELVQVKLATPQGVNGTHLYNSLGVLFGLIETGNSPKQPLEDDGSGLTAGLEFNPLRADLFRAAATAHIDEVGLGNLALQQVLAYLLLSKEKAGRPRGFISYAELGINQLGAVYEGLMSYTGFFAESDLYEVAKNGDASKGSWVVPTDRADGISSADFVTEVGNDGQARPVLHPRGSFVFRLAGRERQQSASYYTPEVLTRFTVEQALEELLDQDGHTTLAAEILDLTVCEPALGSGAFAIEAVRQLAAEYLKRRQDELKGEGRSIPPDDYPKRLQEVKAYLALHNVYGVDLNATAVELAEISLWLDTMVEGLSAPWFGLHLRRGNSLIGARRAIYSRQQVSDKSWLTSVPREMPLASLAVDADVGEVGSGFERGIHHFLLPADGWGAAADATEAAVLEPHAAKALKEWRRSMKARPTKAQLDDLSELAHRVEVLWQFAFRRLEIAEREIGRAIPVWGAGELPAGGSVQREQIEAALADADGAYRRLKRVMDAWCALWFWPLTDQTVMVRTELGPRRVTPPTLAEWIAGLQSLLGRSPEARKRKPPVNNQSLSSAAAWNDLGISESAEMGMSAAQPVEQVLRQHRWLVVCERVAEQQGFFHWNLAFTPIFARRGGFDLQVGNPPWVRPTIDFEALLAEGDPWWKLEVKPSQSRIAEKRDETLKVEGLTELVAGAVTEVVSTAEFVGSASQYPHLDGLQPDLYRCFMTQGWRHTSERGIVGLISYETHFTDEKAGLLREETYLRLRRHWEFVNELQLFEIQHQKHYGVNIFGSRRASPKFDHAVSMYHPDTVGRSLLHDGTGPEPGFKDELGNWDQRPHRARVNTVTDATLSAWHSLIEKPGVPLRQTRMVYLVNRSATSAITRLTSSSRIADVGLQFSSGWHEKNDRTKGFFEIDWGQESSWESVILQGPHLHVHNAMYKIPNKTLRNHLDWSFVDLENLGPDELPVTSFAPSGDRKKFDAAYNHWIGGDGEPVAARDCYRVAWRRRADNVGDRTLKCALIPPGASHVDGVFSTGFADFRPKDLLMVSAALGAMTSDFLIRVVPKGDIREGAVSRLPMPAFDHALASALRLRALRLGAITSAYQYLWKGCFETSFLHDRWTRSDARFSDSLQLVSDNWNRNSPLRRAIDRRQAALEVDSLVALMIGVSIDELCTIYRTQFPVMYGYDHDSLFFDINGRLVPTSVLTVWRRKGELISSEERTATNQAGNTYVYELPFVTLDREADMRQAYAEFERRLTERISSGDANNTRTAQQGDVSA